MSVTQEITELPTAPQRLDPDNFSAQMDDFLGVLENTPVEINEFGAQVNTVGSEVNNNADRAEQAADIVASFTSATIYDAGVTYAAGDTVQDPGDSYQFYFSQQDSNTGHTPNTDDTTWWVLASPSAAALSILDSVAVKQTIVSAKGDLIVGDEEDSVTVLSVGETGQILSADSSTVSGAKWIDLPAGGRTGATEVSSAVDLTLTSSSDFIQNVVMTTALNSVTLPDATTMAEGLAFIIRPIEYEFFICNDSGDTLFSSDNDDMLILLVDNSSADGKWAVMNKTAGVEKILAGDATVFNPAVCTYPSVELLTATKAIVCYVDSGNSDYGTACILDIAGNSLITAGSEVVYNSTTTGFLDAVTLSENQAIVCYKDYGNSQYGTACILDVSGSTITPGTPAVFESASLDYIGTAQLTETQAIVCYGDDGNGGYGTACILDVSGSTITPGTPAVFNPGNTGNLDVAMLTTTKAIVCYKDYTAGNQGTACILDVSGSTITAGAEVVFNTGNTIASIVVRLTATKALVCYIDYSNSVYGTACVLDVSGSTITAGPEVVFNAGGTYDLAVGALSENKVMACFQDGGNSSYGTACVLDVSGDSVVNVTETAFTANSTSSFAGVVLSETEMLVCYKDYGNSQYGTACVLKGVM